MTSKEKNTAPVSKLSYKRILSAAASKSVLDNSAYSTSDEEQDEMKNLSNNMDSDEHDAEQYHHTSFVLNKDLKEKENEDNSSNKGAQSFTLPPPSEELKAVLPDIQDRKCILGCLASILASYADCNDDDFKNMKMKKSFQKEYQSNETQQHLGRRFLFFCKFLEQCSFLMYLETSQARAFFSNAASINSDSRFFSCR